MTEVWPYLKIVLGAFITIGIPVIMVFWHERQKR